MPGGEEESLTPKRGGLGGESHFDHTVEGGDVEEKGGSRGGGLLLRKHLKTWNQKTGGGETFNVLTGKGETGQKP